MVLNDGETYTSVGGCSITQLRDEFFDNDTVEHGLYEEADEPLAFIHKFHDGVVIELTERGKQKVIVR